MASRFPLARDSSLLSEYRLHIMFRVVGSIHPPFGTGQKCPAGFAEGLGNSEHPETRQWLDMVGNVAFFIF